MVATCATPGNVGGGAEDGPAGIAGTDGAATGIYVTEMITSRALVERNEETMREMERQGFEVTYLEVQENGLLDLDAFKAALRSLDPLTDDHEGRMRGAWENLPAWTKWRQGDDAL